MSKKNHLTLVCSSQLKKMIGKKLLRQQEALEVEVLL